MKKSFFALLITGSLLASCANPVVSSQQAAPVSNAGYSLSVSTGPSLSSSTLPSRSLYADSNVSTVTVEVYNTSYTSLGSATLARNTTNSNFAGTFSVSASGSALVYVFGKNSSGSVIWLGSTSTTIQSTGTTSITVPTVAALEATGANGTVYITNLTSNGFTVSYLPTQAYTTAPALYASVGNNSAGLQVSNSALTYSSTTGFWSVSAGTSSSWVSGAQIWIDVLLTPASGPQVNVPQGSLSTGSTWASFIYP
ncbi:MAG: hypothetical protein HKM05_07785 [Spirochaetales bacterium]|nr:hypothetical protein [Spirochaetales bacterium]